MCTGIVKFFNAAKGYGFIIDDETGNEYFAHASKTLERISKDDHVQFDIETGKRGDVAVNIKRWKT